MKILKHNWLDGSMLVELTAAEVAEWDAINNHIVEYVRDMQSRATCHPALGHHAEPHTCVEQ